MQISNNNDNIEKIINSILEISEDESVKYKFTEHFYHFYKKPSYYCIKAGEIVQAYKDLQLQLWNDFKISTIEHIYWKKFVEILDEFIINAHTDNEKLYYDSLLVNVEKQAMAIPLKEYTLITRIYGIGLKSRNYSIQLGNYLICDYDYLVTIFAIEQNIVTSIDTFKAPVSALENCFIIHKKINAIDAKKAEIIFFNKIEQFINAILFHGAFCCDDNEKISYKNSNIVINYMCIGNNEQTIELSSQNQSLINPQYEFFEEFFDDDKKIIYKWIDNENSQLKELERRLKISIDWIGQSLREANLTKRFTFLCIALETLLSDKPSGVMEQGTTYRLREYSAFLATDDPVKRIEIYNKIRSLYNERSAISHSGTSKNLQLKHYYELLEILYPITHKIQNLIKENISTSKDLTKYINKLKGLSN